MTITITKHLSDLYATPEQFDAMTDEQIVELCREDPLELLDGATWTVDREKAK